MSHTNSDHREPNRLSNSASPYLLQHAYNPVDWYPWGEEAFEKAAREDKPIFLSIGYSSCHWCHVMEHESFEDDEVAKLLRENFVSIKVDREERPDVDAIYMTVTQLLSGHGGWPNSLFLTPDRRPFFSGTYFPPEDRWGRPGFKTVLNSLSAAYRDRREEVEEQASEIVSALHRSQGQHSPPAGKLPSREVLSFAVRALEQDFDNTHGGFGSSPKFPPHSSLRLLFYEGTPRSRELAVTTLRKMALGGIHDHVGGGFHRYATDNRWLLPHFEKMLYDNAQLLRSYVDGWRITRDDELLEVIEGIVEWISREMTSPEGAFYSALDADSEGEEGKYYVWRTDEVRTILGDGADLFLSIYRFGEEGNFSDEATGKKMGVNIPHRSASWEELAKARQMNVEVLKKMMKEACCLLSKERSKRVPPQLDDKIVTSWNGLMIASLAYAGAEMSRPDFVEKAKTAAEFLFDVLHDEDGRLAHSWRQKVRVDEEFLDDYAFLAEGCIELARATNDDIWLKRAESLTDRALEVFGDPAGGAFYFARGDKQDLLVRMKDLYDKAEPSGNSIMVLNLLRLAPELNRTDYRGHAESVFAASSDVMTRMPRAVENLVIALGYYEDEIRNVEEEEFVGGAEPTTAGPKFECSDSESLSACLAPAHVQVRPGEEFELDLKIRIKEGWFVDLKGETAGIHVDVLESAGLRMISKEFPEPSLIDEDQAAGQNKKAYSGAVNVKLLLTTEEPAAGPTELKLRLTWSPCTPTECRPAESLIVVSSIEVI